MFCQDLKKKKKGSFQACVLLQLECQTDIVENTTFPILFIFSDFWQIYCFPGKNPLHCFLFSAFFFFFVKLIVSSSFVVQQLHLYSSSLISCPLPLFPLSWQFLIRKWLKCAKQKFPWHKNQCLQDTPSVDLNQPYRNKHTLWTFSVLCLLALHEKQTRDSKQL